MSVIRVEQTEILQGELVVQGAKNAVLPILAATILNKGITVIYGCPDISDVKNTLEILTYLGCKVFRKDDRVTINAKSLNRCDIPGEYTCRLRSSIVFMGAIAARMSEVTIAFPGGCPIGERPIDIHMEALRTLMLNLSVGNEHVYGCTTGLRGNHVKLSFPSVGATENVLFCAVAAKGITIIENYAKEPEIYELCRFLKGMGAIINIKPEVLVVEGVKEFHDSEYRVCGDRIVAGTYLYMTALTGGNIVVNNIKEWHLTEVLRQLKKVGCKIESGNDYIKLTRKKSERLVGSGLVETAPFPKYPTDMQAFATVLFCACEGTSLVRENIFENRFHTARELVRMGADIEFLSDNEIRIRGVNELYGKNVRASDLRDGAALVMAGLFANGGTCVSEVNLINRGYEDIVRDLKILGAIIKYD